MVGNSLYFEIPAAEFGKDFVAVTTLAGTPAGIGAQGTLISDRLIRFERRENRVYLKETNYNTVATDSNRTGARAMSLIEFYPIIAVFNVEAYGKDSASVIDVTRLFTGGVQEFASGGRRAQVDATRSYIDKFAAFSRNVNVTAVQTFTAGPVGLPPGLGAAAAPSTEAYTYSIVKLPDNPMMPRFQDARVGFFGQFKQDFGSPENRVVPRRYISRWRLECSDKPKVNGLCVPIKPITYYVDPATPKWLQPWIKRAIEEWQPAFEEAGFYKGIVAADAPNDPDFSGEDASVAMVRWLPSPVANAVGPSTVDPRTGEIIDADVQMYFNVQDLQRTWYFAQVGHLDLRAQKFPLPDSLMGRLIEFVAAHEVGHTLGFPHNMKASSMYPLDSVRSKTWVAKMGHSPSIMDYARFNYVAQPEDGIPLGDLVPRVGPYDKFAVKWGYTPIPAAMRPEDETATLDRWARMQDTIPWFRFASDAGAGGADPGEQSEAIGDADAVGATRLGFKNIARVMKLVEPAASTDHTADFALLRTTYNGVIGQWATEANHVTRIIGGMNKQEKNIGQAGPVWTSVSRERQRAAMKFLNDEVFSTPKYLIVPAILQRLESDGNISRVSGAQSRALSSVLNTTKMQRMVEYEAMSAKAGSVYTVSEMLGELRHGLWSEIYSGKPIDAYRRHLQNLYTESMAAKINPPPVPAALAQQLALFGGSIANTDDVRPILKDEMRMLDKDLASAIGRTGDRMSRAHLQDTRDQIKRMLDPKQ
ncbi:MAG: zinc-dependent metalloprotease [Gemmatimonadota bacterium]|nr:zinc-dependent metalloprotease [Gemmatimonadota bacterium]